MPILSAGSSVTLSVAAGQVLTVQSDQATYDFENPVGTRVGEYAYDKVFGPFTVAGSVKLTSVQGPLFYELGTGDSPTALYVPSSVSITGGVIAGGRAKGLSSFDTKRGLALREWFRALSNRASSPAVLMGVGDSISEGKGATSYLTRWNARLPLLLSSDYPTSGVTRPTSFPQYLEVQMTTNTGDFPVTTPSGFGPDTPNKGLGARSINISGSQTVVVTVSGGTSVDVIYYRATGTRTLGVKLDAGAVTNVDGGSLATLTDWFTYRVTLPDTGSHTITLSAVSGAVGIDGFYVYNGDETKGIRYMLGGRASAPSSMFSSTTATYLGQQVAAIQPNCVLIELGANDYQNTGPITAAAFSTNLSSIISNIRANCSRPPSIVLLPVWTWTPGTTPVETGGWAAYVDAMNAISAGDDDICICDLQQKMTLSTSNDASLARGLISGDSIHPSDAGHWMISETLRAFLRP